MDGQGAQDEPGGGALTALVVDDHPLFCDALTLTLRAICPFREVTTAGSLEEAIGKLGGRDRPDLVFLDLNLPDVNGLDGLARLKSVAPATTVMVVSSLSDPRIVAGALEAGASGFVPKHSTRDVFRGACETVLAGGTYLPEGFSESIGREDETTAAVRRLVDLTGQQARILQLICEGKLNKQIAFDLSIAETTVKAHVTAIMRKLGVQSRTQAVLVAKKASFAQVLPD